MESGERQARRQKDRRGEKMSTSAAELRKQATIRILEAWRRRRLAAFGVADMLRPRNLAQAYGIQEAVSTELGAIGGWRICQPHSETGRACAPLALSTLRPEPASVKAREGVPVHLRPGICFRLGANLPDYDAPYTRTQVLGAIESCHPAVDVLQPRTPNPKDALWAIADACGHRQLVYGRPASACWESGDVPISIFQSGKRTLSRTAHATEDAVDLLQWLANEGSRWGGGLMVGQMVTIDLDAGEIEIATDQPARIVLGWLGAITLRFA